MNKLCKLLTPLLAQSIVISNVRLLDLSMEASERVRQKPASKDEGHVMRKSCTFSLKISLSSLRGCKQHSE